MHRDINLLPPRDTAYQKKFLTAIALLFVIPLFIAVLFYGVFQPIGLRNVKRNQVNQLEKTLPSFLIEDGHLDKTKDELKKWEEDVQFLKANTRSSIQWVDFLNTFEKQIPQDIRLSKLEYHEAELILIGLYKNDMDVAFLLAQLKDMGLFSRVSVETLSSGVEVGSYSFRIICRLME